MDRFKSRRIQVGDLNIRYYTGGKGDPLLIIHGGNSHAQSWAKNVGELSHKYQVYIPDLPGFGLSESLDGTFYIPEFVDFVTKFTGALGLRSFYLMGHSMGGAIAASYTIQNPQQVSKLVLIDSMCMGEEIALWVRVLSTPAFCRSFGKGLVAMSRGAKWVAETMFQSVDYVQPMSAANLVIGCEVSTREVQKLVLQNQLSGIMSPTLIFWGDSDHIVPVKQAFAAAAVIPDCRVKILKGGHCAYARRMPEFSAELDRFLAG